MVSVSSRYGDFHARPLETTSSAKSRFLLQKPDCSQVLKFSCLTAALRIEWLDQLIERAV